MKTINGYEMVIDGTEFKHRPNRLVYLTPPHAPSIVTTISTNSTVNVGTFEQTMLCSNWPAIITLAISPKSDTLRNLQHNGECVIGFPYPENLQLAYDAGIRLDYGESELDLLDGVTLQRATMVAPPHIEQCWLSMEGRLLWEKKAGDHHICAVEILRVIFDSRFWQEDKKERRCGLPAAYYATSGAFSISGKWIDIELSEKIKNKSHSG